MEWAEILYFLDKSPGLMCSSNTSLMILARCSGEKAAALMVLKEKKKANIGFDPRKGGGQLE